MRTNNIYRFLLFDCSKPFTYVLRRAARMTEEGPKSKPSRVGGSPCMLRELNADALDAESQGSKLNELMYRKNNGCVTNFMRCVALLSSLVGNWPHGLINSAGPSPSAARLPALHPHHPPISPCWDSCPPQVSIRRS